MSSYKITLSGKKNGRNWYSVYCGSQRYASLEYNEEFNQFYAHFTKYAPDAFSGELLGVVAQYLDDLNAPLKVASVLEDSPVVTVQALPSEIKPRKGRVHLDSRLQWVVNRLSESATLSEEYGSLTAALRDMCENKSRAAITLSEMLKDGFIIKQFVLTKKGALRAKLKDSGGT